MKALTQQQKNIVDNILHLSGAVLGLLASGQFGFLVGTASGAISSGLLVVIGIVGGDVVSDLLAYVDTGQIPSVATVQSQAQTALNAIGALPNLTPLEKQALEAAQLVIQAHPPA